MKQLTSLLIGCSLALAGAAFAQQPDDQQSPAKTQGKEKAHNRGEAKAGESATKPEAEPLKPHPGKGERAAARMQKPEATPKSTSATSTETNASAEPAASAMPNSKQHGKGKNAHDMNAKVKASPSATPAASVAASATPATATASATPVVTASASAAPTGTATNLPNNRQVNGGAVVKKPDVQKVEQIKTQHASFRSQPKPQQVPTVTFNQSYRIEGSDRWQGQQYEVFRSYHPERHDERFYHSHYQRVELIGGGYYYFNNGYWYPAWGYSSSAQYYAYDGPIYVGHRSEPPDRVIADVQAVLQDMGYYKGEVDGLLGPLTREALTSYQSEQGLTATAAIDEPTLDALGMG